MYYEVYTISVFFPGLSLEYGDVPCGGSITGIGKVHGTDIMVE